MIFVTVGTQLPFDRLIRSMDQWAHESKHDVFAQTGNGVYKPMNIDSMKFLGVKEFDRRVSQADLLVSHAGIGSIITAMEMSKPIVVMPRLARFGEHRNDHQLATVSKLKELNNVFVAESEHDLGNAIREALDHTKTELNTAPTARAALVTSISDFISSDKVRLASDR
ncbi:MAG: hypothetical protein JJ957_08990 [Pseudomonadales bacterium]|nr:hypothetical protein [Pseudomonadales bacterium]MBO6563900.1 hypothetical protein [Pseudomonadales bacterium]MBO6596371.1 hypothetical protein [Pseudomonadales bacterium]MBO6822851.1 hypothetical protein [Pseudomonadales bacterium]